MPNQATSAPELVDLLQAGAHFGHERSKRNPKMETFVWERRNRIAIIDLEQTHAHLKTALKALSGLAANTNRDILFVGTKRQARAIVKRHAESIEQPYVTRRWLGGTLTNFSTIQKSIEKLDELKSKQGTAAEERMTKKEKAVMQKEIERLEEVLEGLKSLKSLPAAIVVAGSHDERLAVKEATRIGIPIFGIADTNADPDLLTYPIPANDDAVRSLDLIVGALASAIADGRKLKIKKTEDNA
jgi:small subunit ribosomal protein S2